MKREVPDSYDKRKVERFLERWGPSGASERANSQLFIKELCDLLGVEPPRPATGDPSKDTYCFERPVEITRPDSTKGTNFIDLYKQAHFVFESKQGSERRAANEEALLPAPKAKKGTAVRETVAYDLAMQRATVQAERYAKALPEWPPFLIICDVGYCFELQASFDGSGKYRHFPSPGENRIAFSRLTEPETFGLLHTIFTEPKALDPAREAAKVTQEIAALVAKLAVSLEKSGHAPELVAKFLMRCLFTMFAEDVGLLPPAENGQGLFTHALEHHWVPEPESFPSQLGALWQTMNSGGSIFRVAGKILKFNGGLFLEPVALPMTREQLQVLQLAAIADWSGVEPAIFGTLLERALNPNERHRLGAHFTPRSYVERLVAPTIEEPIREEWNLSRAQVRQIMTSGGKVEDARKVLRGFHRRLVEIKVLDPACGSGNFLYVTLDLFKRIEAEVLAELADLGDTQMLFDVQNVSVNPGQFLGIEIKPWAREIADLCLWIGYLQWHRRTRGTLQPVEPVLREYKNIECRDALIEYDRIEPVLDEDGKAVTRWDGDTHKVNPVTGEQVPDERAVVPLHRYVNVRSATWPQADFIIGNPPFVGTRRMRLALTDGYVEALVQAWPAVAENADLVMYWWHHAAELARVGKIRRFGLITTNSITQTFNRSVIRPHLDASDPVSIVYAIPDHPWVDSMDGAAVRVAMTVGQGGTLPGVRLEVTDEEIQTDGSASVTVRASASGRIREDLRSGASPASAVPLLSNADVAFWGVKFYGDGFIVTKIEADALALAQGGRSLARPFISGRDLTGKARRLFALDCDGLDEEALARQYPPTYQHLLERVKPVRAHNPRAFKRERWWIFGENQPGMRRAVAGIERYVATTETAKHRVFQFFSPDVLAEGTVSMIALSDPFFMGVLSSRVHVTWALAAGGRLGVGNDPRYNKTRCFDPFPFPSVQCAEAAKIRELALALDAHRKRAQEQHADLTITEVYNVLEKLRAAEELSTKERSIKDRGLVSILRQLHDDLDQAVCAAYGWPGSLTDEELIANVVALNAERAMEERRGLVRWLRPEYQSAGSEASSQTEITGTETPPALVAVTMKTALKWPKEVPAQLAAIKALFDGETINLSVDDVCAAIKGARKDKVLQHLLSLEGLGLLDRYDAGGVPRWHA